MSTEFAEEQLELLLYNDNKFVTALTLARYGDVDAKQALRIMTDFYGRVDAEQKKKHGLYAVYLMSGERNDRDDSHRDATILVREADLEKTKTTFSRIDSCTLFSLQCQPLDELYHLFRTDDIDNLTYLESDHERIGIAFTERIMDRVEIIEREAKKKMPTSFDVMKMNAAGKTSLGVTAFKRAEEEKKKKKEEAEAKRLEALFQAACDRQKTPKNSPKKLPASPFSTGKKSEKDEEASNSPIVNRKRQRKIRLDNESGEEEEKSEESPKEKREVKKRKEEEKKKEGKKKEEKKKAVIDSDEELFDASDEKVEEEKEKKKEGKKKQEKKKAVIDSDDELFDASDDKVEEEKEKERKKEEEKAKKKKKKVVDSDDDLFDAADDSPVKKEIKEEEMDVDEEEPKKSKKKGKKEEKGTRTLEQTGALRRSPRKHAADSSSGPVKRFVQRDTTVVTDDGSMTTKREMVEVEVSEEELRKEREREEARRPLEANKKANVPAAKTSAKGAAGAKKPAAGQSKISSFFTKK